MVSESSISLCIKSCQCPCLQVHSAPHLLAKTLLLACVGRSVHWQAQYKVSLCLTLHDSALEVSQLLVHGLWLQTMPAAQAGAPGARPSSADGVFPSWSEF